MALMITKIRVIWFPLFLKEYDVIAEHSKTEDFARAATEKFEVILVDYHLPDGNGLELCVLIRAFDPDTPISW